MIFNIIATSILIALYLIIKLFFLPIDALIGYWIPNLSSGLTSVNSLLDIFSDNLPFAMDILLFPPAVYVLIATYYFVAISLPLAVYLYKLFISWWNTIK